MAALPSAFEPFVSLARPVAISDPGYRIVHLNERALAYWGLRPGEADGEPMDRALRLFPPQGRELDEWVRDVLFVALTTGDPFACRTRPADGQLRPIRLTGFRFLHGEAWHTAWVVGPEAAPAAEAVPGWALRDPVTGLLNRHQWDLEFSERDRAGGTLVLFDVDDLKAINDLFGHPAGDRALAAAAAALSALAPPEALVVRLGGDEFAVILPSGAAEAEAFAQRVVAEAVRQGSAAGLDVPLGLGHGLAAFGPGGLEMAIRSADDALYERKGVLLRASGPGRIVLMPAARGRLLAPGAPERPHDSYARNFGPEWDRYFRRMFARAAEQAREFVTAIGVEPGGAVIEVAAGSGRITFDGGLAERVGPLGQLLVTDASEAQLQVARARAHALHLDWVRFLQAPVEELPLASGSADLVLGSTFLHFTDPAIALSSMARVVRPGGLVAVNASQNMTWGPAWQEILEPVRAELDAAGLPFLDFLPGRAEIEAAVTLAGLVLERVEIMGAERMEFPSAEVAQQIMRQIAFVRLFLKAVPEARHATIEAAVEERLRAVFARGVGEDEIAGGIETLTLVARRPG